MSKTVYYTLDKLSADGFFYIKLTADDSFEPFYPFTTTPIPDGLKDPRFNFLANGGQWEGGSTEAAEQRQAAAEKAAQEAKQAAAQTAEQLTTVSGILTTASAVISSPAFAATISDADALKLGDLWPTWAVGATYGKGQVVIFDGKTYRHHADSSEAATDQLTPSAANYLWTPITLTESGDVVWAQPTGYQNAYAKGAVVLYSDGKHYTSLIDGNTQVPGTDDRYWKLADEAGETTTADAGKTAE